MDELLKQLTETIITAIAALVPVGLAAVPIMRAYLAAKQQEVLLAIQERLGGAAARAAAEIAAQLKSNPHLQSSAHRLAESAALRVTDAFQETMLKHGLDSSVPLNMIAGELGKLGVNVNRSR